MVAATPIARVNKEGLMAVTWGDGEDVQYRQRFVWWPVLLWDWHVTSGKMWVRRSRKKSGFGTIDEMMRYDGVWLPYDPHLHRS